MTNRLLHMCTTYYRMVGNIQRSKFSWVQGHPLFTVFEGSNYYKDPFHGLQYTHKKGKLKPLQKFPPVRYMTGQIYTTSILIIKLGVSRA